MDITPVTVTQDPEKFIWEVIPQPERVGLLEIQVLNNSPIPFRCENHPSIKKMGKEIVVLKCTTSTGLKTRVWMGKKTFEEHFSHLS